MRRKFICFLLMAVLLLSCSANAFAADGYDPNRKCSIGLVLLDQKYKLPVAGAEFEVYHVADVGINTDNNLNYSYTQPFKNCGIALNDPELADKLSSFVEENTVASKKMVTDEFGEANCIDLKQGMYLLKHVGGAEGFSRCRPFMVMLPVQNGSEFQYDVNAAPKADVAKLVTVNINVVWNVDKTTEIPNNVTVDLLRDGVVVESAVLGTGNNWKIRYPDMPDSDAYSVIELNVPKGFTVSYKYEFVPARLIVPSSSRNSQYGIPGALSEARYSLVPLNKTVTLNEENLQDCHNFTIINTATLAQTGQTIWPIPVLAAVGLLFLAVGFVILRKPEKDDA